MPSYMYNIFGAGPRTCVRKDLAFREMKIVVEAIIWSYNLRVIKGHSCKFGHIKHEARFKVHRLF
ncbi:hypothetical protein QQ045_001892 [Rhodiola kirilowii]